MMMRARLLPLLLLLALSTPAFAVQPGEKLDDPALEARARTISKELRCLVCQNQSIDDSDADLAADLRRLVRDRLTAGDSDAEVIDYIVARYGEFVLLRPRFEPATLLLWLSPFAVIILGGAGLLLVLRRRRGEMTPQALDLEEKSRIAALLREADE
jgi:cytochrome c-type biogenesis protein CcmH